jgi:hypothetical protein
LLTSLSAQMLKNFGQVHRTEFARSTARFCQPCQPELLLFHRTLISINSICMSNLQRKDAK